MWIAAWLIASAVTVAVFIIAVTSWIVLPAIEIARSARRFQDEVGSIAGDISRGADRARERGAAWSTPERRGSR